MIAGILYGALYEWPTIQTERANFPQADLSGVNFQNAVSGHFRFDPLTITLDKRFAADRAGGGQARLAGCAKNSGQNESRATIWPVRGCDPFPLNVLTKP